MVMTLSKFQNLESCPSHTHGILSSGTGCSNLSFFYLYSGVKASDSWKRVRDLELYEVTDQVRVFPLVCYSLTGGSEIKD